VPAGISFICLIVPPHPDARSASAATKKIRTLDSILSILIPPLWQDSGLDCKPATEGVQENAVGLVTLEDFLAAVTGEIFVVELVELLAQQPERELVRSGWRPST